MDLIIVIGAVGLTLAVASVLYLTEVRYRNH
jgi:hypothetical protein